MLGPVPVRVRVRPENPTASLPRAANDAWPRRQTTTRRPSALPYRPAMLSYEARLRKGRRTVASWNDGSIWAPTPSHIAIVLTTSARSVGSTRR